MDLALRVKTGLAALALLAGCSTTRLQSEAVHRLPPASIHRTALTKSDLARELSIWPSVITDNIDTNYTDDQPNRWSLARNGTTGFLGERTGHAVAFYHGASGAIVFNKGHSNRDLRDSVSHELEHAIRSGARSILRDPHYEGPTQTSIVAYMRRKIKTRTMKRLQQESKLHANIQFSQFLLTKYSDMLNHLGRFSRDISQTCTGNIRTLRQYKPELQLEQIRSITASIESCGHALHKIKKLKKKYLKTHNIVVNSQGLQERSTNMTSLLKIVMNSTAASLNQAGKLVELEEKSRKILHQFGKSSEVNLPYRSRYHIARFRTKCITEQGKKILKDQHAVWTASEMNARLVASVASLDVRPTSNTMTWSYRDGGIHVNDLDWLDKQKLGGVQIYGTIVQRYRIAMDLIGNYGWTAKRIQEELRPAVYFRHRGKLYHFSRRTIEIKGDLPTFTGR
jgi:hypothetical protein